MMGLVGSVLVLACGALIASNFTRLNNIEVILSVRGERLRAIEVQLVEQNKYETSRDGDLKSRLSRIEMKLDSLDAKVSKLP